MAANSNGEYHGQNLPKPWIRTPLIYSLPLSRAAGCQIYLKLENLQPSGSFKSRGIGNFLVSHLASAAAETNKSGSKTHFYSSSGGNAGLACVVAAVALGTSATIVVPLTTSQYMMDKMRTAGATNVIQVGKSWMEADTHLRESVLPEARAKGENAVYVHPYDAQQIWDGHSTLIGEIVEDMTSNSATLDAIVCSVGGGGLLCGIMQGLDGHGLSDLPVVAMETNGANSLAESVQQGELVTLPAITSIATTLGARRVAAKAFEYAKRPSVKTLVVDDREAVWGCWHLADLHRILVELSCSVCIASCFEERLKKAVPSLNEQSKVVLVVCGGSNITTGMLEKWMEEYP